jgi:hypothetical protein
MNLVYIILLGFAAGTSKAVRDTVAHHWSRSIFSRIRSRRWNIWFASKWELRPDHPVWFLWDAWHFFDSLEILCLIFSGVWISNYWGLICVLIMVGIGFEICYKRLFLSK